jgi:hypothetical protein
MNIPFLSGIGSLPARDLAMVILLVKATIILIAALGITVMMQKASAGARHLVWLVALGTLLVVPALTAWAPLRLEILPPLAATLDPAVVTPPATAPVPAMAAPRADVDAQPTTTTTPAPAVAPSWTSRLSAMSALSLVFTVWIVVATLILLSLAWSALIVRRIVRQARPLTDES